jgi:phosphodiesterase/alkaline phosphatase D-like protein
MLRRDTSALAAATSPSSDRLARSLEPRRRRRWILIMVAVIASAAGVVSRAGASSLTLGGVVVGDVTARDAVFWVRDPSLERRPSSTDYVAYGPLTAGPPLPLALRAFLDYTPVAVASTAPDRIYRELRYGRNLDLFVLHTRQYRDANFAIDDPRAPKTMLGREQLTWLKQRLVASTS